MYGISAKQIRAARAMLGWSQEDLAMQARLGASTIGLLEKGNLAPRSALEVQRAFENAGLVFFENDGLSQRNDIVKLYQGTAAGDMFLDDLFETISGASGPVVITAQRPDVVVAALGGSGAANIARFAELADKEVWCLLAEPGGQKQCLLPFEFRVSPKFSIGPSMQMAYGNKYALALGEDESSYRYVCFRSMSVAQSFVKDFLPIWACAVPLPVQPELHRKRRA